MIPHPFLCPPLTCNRQAARAAVPAPERARAMSNPFDEPADEDEELSRLVDEELTLGADVLADVDALMQATDLDELMSPADVAVLRGLLKAVQQDTSLHERLDAFIATHCHELVSYSAGEHCEHKLEWVRLSIERPSAPTATRPVAPRPAGPGATDAAVHAAHRPRCTRSTPRSSRRPSTRCSARQGGRRGSSSACCSRRSAPTRAHVPWCRWTPLSLQPCAIQTATRCAQAATLSVQAATLRTTGDAQLDGLHGILRAAARARDGGWWGGVTRQAPRWQVVPAERKSTRSSSNCHYSH